MELPDRSDYRSQLARLDVEIRRLGVIRPCQPTGAKVPCSLCRLHGQTPPPQLDPVAALLGGRVESEPFRATVCRLELDKHVNAGLKWRIQ